LFSGEEVSKDSERTEAYGALDELVSHLGLARAQARRDDVRGRILDLQRELFTVGAELATTTDHVHLLKARVDAAMLGRMEAARAEVEAAIRMPDGFIIPGGTVAAAHLDVARAVSRRLERRVAGLAGAGLVKNNELTVWVNRLSDYLWLLARLEEGEATVLK
jgi:cob(I)alamin adenosyltransferase